ncbi:RNaseH ribonuclease [Synechococcus phage S-CRM01]|uniref:RNaseH ribonuclease n=1 Tax=Synechococcus phage S-CRM01 TaxID=1026955 RepID=UPI000209E38F|nr:RNaseH ribonuclease [Synechococcus phage S-CRM01]AEC53029.1 RNaseH ribonuclease [Synechococcus phage S-CRM01]
MILIDANQISISHLMVRNKIEKGINIETVRKSVIRVLGRIHNKYRREYGEMVLCYDDKEYWRKEVFPLYKKNRKQEREESNIDWDHVFSVLNKIRDEIRINFPYKVIQAQGAEADDIIATLCMHNSHREIPDRVLILSADKDFIQLHKYDFVKQYDPIRNRWIKEEYPIFYLQEHIIRGDRSDGIPNILTCDDAIVNHKPQKKMSAEKIQTLATMDPKNFNNFVRIRNWKRNAQLIDFQYIPQAIRDRILTIYHKAVIPTGISLEYFSQHNITDILSEFT